MKILHVADLHFDRPFEGLGRTTEDLKKDLLLANQQVLNNIAKKAIEHQVEMVIMVGDTFHQSKITIHYQQLLWDFFKALETAKIQIVLTFGNHDFYQATRYWQKFPKNVLIFNKEAVETKVVKTKSGFTVALHGFSYEHSHIEVGKISEFTSKSNVDFEIGIYHGQQGVNSYAPFNLFDLKKRNYDYWALGHIHQYTQLADSVFYPGTPQGKNIKEGNKGGVLLVEFDTKKNIKVTRESVATVDWVEIEVTIKPKNMSEVIDDLMKQVMKNFLNIKKLTLLQLTLLVEESVSQEWLEEWQQLDRLAYLQELFYQKSQGKCWLVNSHLKAANSLLNKATFLDQEWLEQLVSLYRKEEIYAANYDEIRQHPMLEAEFIPFIVEQKDAIIDEAFVEFQQELGGTFDDY